MEASRLLSVADDHFNENQLAPAFASLRCPACKGPLTGSTELRCARCRSTYAVVDGIPVMLPPGDGRTPEQDLNVEKQFYEDMFGGLKGLEDGHCIVYGHDRIYDFVSAVERGSVFEAGCGAGHHSVSLARRGFRMTSMDLSVNAVRAARRLAEHERQNILFLSGDIKRLPFADNEFDICFCSLVLHHFKKLDALVAELSRVTRRYFIAFEVNALDPISFFRFNVLVPTIGVKNISSNQRALFPGRLASLLKQNGFDDVVLKYDDMHEYLGRAPESLKARMIRGYQKVMRVLPEKYSSNKFLLRAEKRPVPLAERR